MVSIFGFEITRGKKEDVEELGKDRPTRGYGTSDYLNFETQFDNIYLGELYDYAFYSDTYRTIIETLERELFRNGIETESDFVSKCTNPKCEKEFKEETEACDKCNSETREPSEEQKQLLESFEECANLNKQTFEDLLGSIEPDLDVVNNGYLLAMKEYGYDTEGYITQAKVKEFIRGDPLFLRKIISRKGVPGIDFHTNKPVMVCPIHRKKRQSGEWCSVQDCNKHLYPAHYYTWGDSETYYIAGEVCHQVKFSKTVFYGFPMALTVINKVKTLIAMDMYVLEYYTGKKSPKGLLAIYTANTESANSAWDKFLSKTEENPHSIWPLFVPPASAKETGDPAKYIDFARSLEEMQYMEARVEMTNKIGAPFGVSPIFQNDLSTSGGLNNEGMQITITTRGMESAQKPHNAFLKFMREQLDVTDWTQKLGPPEERDEMADLQLEQQRILNAQGMALLNYDAELNAEGEFEYNKSSSPPTHIKGSDLDVPEVDEPQAPAGSPQPLGKQDKKKDKLLIKGMVGAIAGLPGGLGNLSKPGKQEMRKSAKKPPVFQPRLEDVKKIEEMIYGKAFNKLSKAESDRVRSVLVQNIANRGDYNSAKKAVAKAAPKLSPGEVTRIVSNEENAIRNSLLEGAFGVNDPKGKHLFKWLGPNFQPGRSTDICQRIKLRTVKGVPMEELKKIVREEAIRGGSKNPREWQPHFGCRHSLSRVFN